jgi:hypothetical protein
VKYKNYKKYALGLFSFVSICISASVASAQVTSDVYQTVYNQVGQSNLQKLLQDMTALIRSRLPEIRFQLLIAIYLPIKQISEVTGPLIIKRSGCK